LNNITRHLVMLEGISHVFHRGHYDLVMHPYTEIDVFDGGWDSSGEGKVTDFNLMVSDSTHGRMSVIDQEGTVVLGHYCKTCGRLYNWVALFCGCGWASLAFSTSL
jgi:hypothetical protein